jgi:hypothetical protein
LVFEKNAKFFAENGQKSQKIVIITSTPGCGWSKKFAEMNAGLEQYFAFAIVVFFSTMTVTEASCPKNFPIAAR